MKVTTWELKRVKLICKCCKVRVARSRSCLISSNWATSFCRLAVSWVAWWLSWFSCSWSESSCWSMRSERCIAAEKLRFRSIWATSFFNSLTLLRSHCSVLAAFSEEVSTLWISRLDPWIESDISICLFITSISDLLEERCKKQESN